MSLRLAKTAGDLLLTFEGRSINGASADFSAVDGTLDELRRRSQPPAQARSRIVLRLFERHHQLGKTAPLNLVRTNSLTSGVW